MHGGQINDIRFSADGTHFVTASADMTSKLIDTQSLEARSQALSREIGGTGRNNFCYISIKERRSGKSQTNSEYGS